MNIIKLYEMKYIDLEELKLRIDGAVSDALEDEVGYDVLEFYVRLAGSYVNNPNKIKRTSKMIVTGNTSF